MSRAQNQRVQIPRASEDEDSRRTDTTITTGDVTLAIPNNNVPNNIQSIITQVSRDQPPQTPPTPHALTTRAESKPLSTGAAPSNPNYPTQRRNFFQRLLCCAPKSGPSHHNAGVLPSNSSFILTKKASFGSQKSQGSDYGFLSTKTDNKKCLALDLDETLVHSSFQPVDCASFVISVTIEGICHSVYVIKRPGVDEFLERMAEHYELIVYTASLSKYADPLLDLLDKKNLVAKRLFRENCVFYDGHYVKDLSLLNREISQTIIVDNSPMSYIFHPENAIDCSSFFDDPSDVELWQIADFLEGIRSSEDVRHHCRRWREWCRDHPSSVPTLIKNPL